MSKIALSVIVYGPFLNKTTIKTNKKQMDSSADTFFLNNPLRPNARGFVGFQRGFQLRRKNVIESTFDCHLRPPPFSFLRNLRRQIRFGGVVGGGGEGRGPPSGC